MRAALTAQLRLWDPEWIRVASELGFGVERGGGAYVSYVPSVITVADYDDLDPDDFLGQIVLHELCHWWTEGAASRDEWDWGLDNMSTRHDWREHAALRLQAAIAAQWSLRHVFVATTDFRPYYETLPADLAQVHAAVDDHEARDHAAAVLAAWQLDRGGDPVRALLARMSASGLGG